MIDNKETSYICQNYVCDSPITDPEQLDNKLAAIFKKSY
jgi:uncharacterized protein YyaL (SSP411 family)